MLLHALAESSPLHPSLTQDKRSRNPLVNEIFLLPDLIWSAIRLGTVCDLPSSIEHFDGVALPPGYYSEKENYVCHTNRRDFTKNPNLSPPPDKY